MGTLTQKFDKQMNDIIKRIGDINPYYVGDFEDIILRRLKISEKSAKPEIKAEICDMFLKSGIECEKQQTDQYYIDMLEKYRADLPSYQYLEIEIMKILYNSYYQYLTPAQYMDSLVDRLEKRESNDSTNLRILKRFIQYDYAGYNKQGVKRYIKEKYGIVNPNIDEVISNIDEGIFELVDLKTSEYMKRFNLDKKTAKNQREIIKAANDLANGFFRTQSGSLEYLYRFAVVYDMTYYAHSEGEFFDYDTDIKKNLFEDFYNNNIMRYIENVYRDKHGDFTDRGTEYDPDPIGRGINAKDYKEVIYLYYIWNGNKTPIKDIEKKIISVKKRMGEEKRTVLTNNVDSLDEGTFIYKENLIKEGVQPFIFEMEEEIFENYLVEHYYIEEQGNYSQLSAYGVFQDILEQLDSMGWNAEGLWIVDTENTYFIKEELKKCINDFDEKRYDNLENLLFGMDWFLKSKFSRYGKKFDGINERNISRTSLMCIYYYYYVQKNRLTTPKEKSFAKVLDEFSTGVNVALIEANYQKFSVKSIFDILLVFSAFARFNI